MPVCILVLHNLRSAHNVGSIFRTADACGVSKIYLTGYTPTPIDRFGRGQSMIAKTALGAEQSIPWEYAKEAEGILANLKKEENRIIAVEQSNRSTDYKEISLGGPTVFIFGNEVGGIEEAILSLCDEIIEIPMRGTKESLNVSVSAGIVLARVTNL